MIVAPYVAEPVSWSKVWDQCQPVRIEHYWSGEPAIASRHAEVRICWSDEALHARWTATLRMVEEGQWSRAIMHPENGRMTMDDLLQMYEWHCRHHLGHLKA